MGLDQEILRGNHSISPTINQENGEWMNAKKLLYLRKAYWLHNKMMSIGIAKLKDIVTNGDGKLDFNRLNTVCIPLTRDELLDILEKSKECVRTESMSLMYEYFDYEPYNEFDFEWDLEVMKEFNMVMNKFLRNKKETEYYYWSWW